MSKDTDVQARLAADEAADYIEAQAAEIERCGRGLVSEGWHVVPVGDLREHESLPSCWCKPRQDEDEPLVWVHNSMDRREHTVEKGVVQ